MEVEAVEGVQRMRGTTGPGLAMTGWRGLGTDTPRGYLDGHLDPCLKQARPAGALATSSRTRIPLN